MAGALDKVLLPVATLKIAVTRPTELFDRLDGRRENERQNARGAAGDAEPNRSDPVAAAHEVLGESACSACGDEVAAVEDELLGTDGGHRFDGGRALAHALWVIVRHRRPAHVVETGVARGVSSAFMLDALERNDAGRLWSIDLPPVRYTSQIKIGSAVPERLRHRWTYVRGASRRHLPAVLDEAGSVGVFVHDGLHTPETMTFEFHQVWPYLDPGGVVVADDVNANDAFVDFARRVDRDPLLVGEPTKETLVGLLRA